MKRLAICILLLLSTPAFAAKHSLSFDSEEFYLVYSNQNADNSVNEYVRKGEHLENWKKMVALHIYHRPPPRATPADFARAIAVITKQKNPKLNVQIMENKRTGEALLDFFLSVDNPKPVVEYNVFRFKPGPVAGTMLGFQYAFRQHGNNARDIAIFSKTLKENRGHWIKLASEAPFPKFVPKGDLDN